jgi:SpoVK/Ycf46/Vps4 family AAA+-type ATPase
VYLKDSGDQSICFEVARNWDSRETADRGRESETSRQKRYHAVQPNALFTFDRLVLPQDVRDRIMSVLGVFTFRKTLFEDWQLKAIARPTVALSLEGEPGTGKTMTAHAIAHYLGKPILHASYAEIESMYHGEGPKNVKAVFAAAMDQDAVLFVDDAESLLSRRLQNVSTGSENAINSMRDQFLICLEQYEGLVVFASNKAESYDPALETRFWTVHFDLPNEDQRREIWRRHLPSAFPAEVSVDELAKLDGICGREIRSAVLEVASDLIHRAGGDLAKVVPARYEDFESKVAEIKKRRKTGAGDHAVNLSDKTKRFVRDQANKTTNRKDEKNENQVH